MERWTRHSGIAGLVLVFLGSCSSEALPRGAAHPLLPQGVPVAPALLGFSLGQGQALPACPLQPAASSPSACVQPAAADTAGLQPLLLGGHPAAAGVNPRALGLQLAGALESVSLQIDGRRALEALPGVLGQLCGAPSFDSRMELDGGGRLWSMAWQCSDAQVQLNAVQHEAMAQAALSLTTERGQQWFDGQDMLAMAHTPAR